MEHFLGLVNKQGMPLVAVALGGSAGACLRYCLTLLATRYDLMCPHGTLWANLLGCWAIGVVTSLTLDTELITPHLRLMLATGFCGGFTTMSTFIYELAEMIKDDNITFAGGYFAVTIIGCTGAFCLGVYMIKLLVR